MLNLIEVTGFQSLRKASIRLGRLTVITGPNGSGKSALFRAMLLLARNARGTDYITRGQTACSVTAGNGSWAVRIARSNAPRGRNAYTVARLRDGKWASARYTKLSGQVPPQASELLALTELNFARQFDPPFLLAEPGSAIARRLGELTNISLVFGAAAEAGRLRKQLSRDLDAARGRREALLEEAQEFATLRDRRRAVTAAEEALGRIQATSAARGRLLTLAGRLAAAEKASETARLESSRQAPPPLGCLEQLAAARARLRDLAGRLLAAERDAALHASSAARAAEEEQAASAGVRATLAAAGQCPFCGSAVT